METEHEDIDEGRVMVKLVVRGVLVALPIAVVGLVLIIWIATDRDLPSAMATAAVPSVLIGGFFGGFVGMVRSMKH